MAKKFNRKYNAINGNNGKATDNAATFAIPDAGSGKRNDGVEQQRVDVDVEAGFGFNVDVSGSIWGRGQIDATCVSGHPAKGAGSGRGKVNFKLHLDGEAECEGEVKALLARAFLKILS